MTNLETVEMLVNEAKSNPASSAIFHWLAVRERTRSGITLRNLHRALTKEGYKFAIQDYIPAITLLAKLGLGELKASRRGKVQGLKNITTTLQSIGKAATGTNGGLKGFKSRVKYKQLPRLEPKPQVIKNIEATRQEINLEFHIGDRPVQIRITKSLTPEEISALITKLAV